MKYDKVIYGTSGSDEFNAQDTPEFEIKIMGLGGDDILWYGAYMDGGTGDDTLYVGSGDTVVYGRSGNDVIFDFYGNDVVYAGSGDDYFAFDAIHSVPGDKNDVFLGTGNDTGVVTLSHKFQQNIDGGSGFDTLIFTSDWANMGSLEKVMDFRKQSVAFNLSTVSNFERVLFYDSFVTQLVYFGEFDDAFSGRGSNNRVYGFGGNDFLDAGTNGGNRLYGGEGNDRIDVGGGTAVDYNRAYGEAGNDMIFASFNNMDNSHSRLYGGTGKDGFVHTFNNIWGGADSADYVMDFDPKSDWIGLAADAYFSFDLSVTRPIEPTRTNIVDTAHELSFDLADVKYTEYSNVRVIYDRDDGKLYLLEDMYSTPNLILKIAGAPKLTLDHFYIMTKQFGDNNKLDVLHGDAQANELQGWGDDDIIYGGAGDDRIIGDAPDLYGGVPGKDKLYGEAGNDSIYGGAENDLISGGLGKDYLRGQSGNDTFVYASIKDSTVISAGRDTIYDFTSRDRIDLSKIDAYSKTSGNQAFKFIGTDKFSGKQGEVRYEKASSDTYIYADVNGDKNADFAIRLDDAVTMQKGYFIL